MDVPKKKIEMENQFQYFIYDDDAIKNV